ncbi:MAG: PKD domain-containing protein [Dehalococcoidia bacterium]
MPCVTIPGNLNIPWVTIVNLDPSTKEVNYDGTLFSSVIYRADCPVDLIVTDPEGLIISQDINQIPGAMYITEEYDGNGNSSPCDIVWIPERKPGNYFIQVIPEQSANASDTFTLTVSPLENKWGYTPIILAQNVSMSSIPTEPYTFEVKERTVTNLSYTGSLSGYKLDTVNLTATLSIENGSPLSGKTINFMIGNQSVSAVTDSNGVATTTLMLNQNPSQFYYIEYGYDGDTDYLPYFDYKPFEIINRPPVADAGGPYTGNEGSPITFNGSASYDPDGSIVSYEWDLTGDGNFSDAQDAEVQHTWLDDYIGTISLRVTDDCGATSTSATTVTINNVAPTVIAGPDIANVLVGSTISFNGSFTDPGTLDTHTIVWNFGDGTPAVTGTLTPTHAFTAGGSYTVTLTVTDDDGGIGADTLTVHVNNPPVADTGGPYTGNEGSVITFNGSTSYDPDGIITVYSWNFGDGSATVTGIAPAHAYGDNGIYTVTLTVTDNNGAIGTAATAATIANVAPTVNAGPDMEDVPIGSIINFNGSFTDPGWLDTHTIAWDFGDGTPAVTGMLTPSHAYTSGGDYTATLTVTDDDGGIGTDTAAINVNAPPVADPGGPYTGNEGSPVTFNGSGSYDPDGTIASFEWDLDNDGEYDDASGAIASFTWHDDYSGTVRLRVTDDTGESTIAATTVTVHNVAPAVDAGANVDYVLSGSPVDFSGGFTDPGTGDTHTVEWNFGDGTPIVTGTLTPTHTYVSGGDYTVTLMVTDDDGGVGSDTLTVHVNDAPIAVPGGPYTGNEGSAITFNGSASYDPDGSIVSYEWDLTGDGDFSDAQGAVVQHTWPDDYTGNVSLKVTDDEGATGVATTMVTVNNVAPEVEAGPDQSAECCVTEVAFNGSFTDPGIPDTHTISWDFGDGSSDSGTLTPIHRYCDPGVYTVTLTVTDDDGGVGTDTMTVTVTDTIPPQVSITSPEDGRIYINTHGLIPIIYTTSDICDPAPDIVITLDGLVIAADSIDLRYLELGTHSLTIDVTDRSGNVGTASAAFTIEPQLTAWGRTWGFFEWSTCGRPTSPADFFGSYSYPLVTADDSIYSRISADDSSYWRQTGYKSLPLPWEHSQLFVYTITQDRTGITDLAITWTGHGGNGDLIYHTRLKIWNCQTGSWNTLVDVTSPGSKTFQTYDRIITSGATDYIEAGTGNVYILVCADDNGRGLTQDTEGVFTDYINLRVNSTVDPIPPSTTRYTFAGGGGTDKWCWEGHVHLIDWNGGHPVSPADFSNSYGYAEGGSAAYSALSASDDLRWRSSISHDLGCCAFDRNCELFKFNIAENPSTITNIRLKWEGHGTTGETIYYTTLKIWNPSSGAWEPLHNQRNTTSDVTWIDNIASGCSDYIDETGNIYVLACSQRSGLPSNCGIWTDYVEVTITHQ